MDSHTSSVFNNSLLKVPRNPIIGHPLPRYEQDYDYQLERQNKEKFGTDLEEMAKKKYLDKETNKSFMEFFHDIPEYHEVNHLSNTEFYSQIEKLKLKKQVFEEHLHKEIKFDPKNTEAIENFKKEKLGRNKIKGKNKPSLQPFCATPVNKSINQNVTPDIDSEFSDKDEIKLKKKSTLKPYFPGSISKSLRPAITPDIDSEFSDKEISTKPPSRRSVRIETPSDKFSDGETPEPNFRPKSRAHDLKTSGNLTDWEDFSLKSRSNHSSNNPKNNGNITDWEDLKSKPKVRYTSNDFKEPLSDWQLMRFKVSSDTRHGENVSNWTDTPKFKINDSNLKNSENLKDWEDTRHKTHTNISYEDLHQREWEDSNLKTKGELSPKDWISQNNSMNWEKSKLKHNLSFGDLKRNNWEGMKSNLKTNFSSLDLKYDFNSESKNKSSDQNLSRENNPESTDFRPKSRVDDFRKWEDLSIENLNLNSDYNSPEPLQTRSAPTTPVKSKPKQEWNSGGITIPKPFQMTVRDEENKIIEELYVKMKKPKEEKPEMFKAHNVPIESQIPLFDKIVAERERRSFFAKEKRKASLRAQMKPFSFTKRDEEIQELTRELSKSSPNLYSDPPLKIKKFKAKPIPKNLFSNYIYHKMHEDEYYRALQKKIRAEELLKLASLPPSMAKREKTKPKLNVCPRSYSSLSKEEKPIKKSRSVPNYSTFHDKYEKELEDLKNEFITTSPRPFRLKTSKRGRRNLRQSSASSKGSSAKTITSSSFNLSSINTSNLAAILRIQSARNKLEMEMLKKLEEAQLKEEARWREKLFRKKPVWQILAYSHEEDLAMRLQLRRDEEKLRSEEHKMRMQLMYGRVQQKPTLFERQSQVKYPKSREELECQLRMIYGKPSNKHYSERSISNLSNKRSVVHSGCHENFNLDIEGSDISKEKESSEEKEKCDCLCDEIDNDKLE